MPHDSRSGITQQTINNGRHLYATRLKAKLVPRTISNALKNIPFYQSSALKSRDEVQLSDFPIIFKETVDNNFDSFVALQHFPEMVFVTGGTTRSPSASFHSRDELDRMFSYAYGLRPGEMYPQSGVQGFLLNVSSDQAPVGGPRGKPFLGLPFTRLGHARLIKTILERGLIVGGERRPVQTLSIATRELKALTQILMQTDYDPRSAQLRNILVRSDYVTSKWKKIFLEYWGCNITSVYGLSEFSYAATASCPHCSCYHFPPYVHWEVVTPDGDEPESDGDGVLVLTSLYPFVKFQPRIRYWTGDVVSFGPYCKAACEKGLKFLGRTKHCGFVQTEGRYRCVFSPFQLLEALDLVEGVVFEPGLDEFTPQYGIQTAPSAFLPIGSPMALVSTKSENDQLREINLSVEIERPSGAKKLQQDSFAEAIRAALTKVNPSLLGDLTRQDIQLQIHTRAANELLNHSDFVPLC